MKSRLFFHFFFFSAIFLAQLQANDLLTTSEKPISSKSNSASPKVTPFRAQMRATLIESVNVPIVQNGKPIGAVQAHAGSIVQILKCTNDSVEISTRFGVTTTSSANLLPIKDGPAEPSPTIPHSSPPVAPKGPEKKENQELRKLPWVPQEGHKQQIAQSDPTEKPGSEGAPVPLPSRATPFTKPSSPAQSVSPASGPITETETFAGPYHVEVKRTQQITLTYTISAETPDDRVEKWVVNLPEPPATGSQKIDKVDFTVEGNAAEWAKRKEESALKRPFRAVVIGKDGVAPGKITITTIYKATMFDRRLVVGKPPEAVSNLSADEVRAWTAATPTCDYLDTEVQEWIEKHGLTKATEESTLRFAWRVFQVVQKNLRYELPNGEANFFRCSRTVKTGKGDCGASNLLFCAALRNSGIPARVYCGRMVINPNPGASHSRGEFYADGVGWVPVDATAPTRDGGERFERFGNDPGLYFATSLDTDWQIELPVYGVQRLTWIHQYAVPYRLKRKPTWEGFKLRESFALNEQSVPLPSSATPFTKPSSPAQAVSPASGHASPARGMFWLTESGKRHNSTCRFYKKSKGKPCGSNEGTPCGTCGG